jgi:gliding motility-associated-like protein
MVYKFAVGVSQVEWKITDSSGNITSCKQEVVINADLEKIIPFAGNDTTICEGLNFIPLTSRAYTGTNLKWSTSGTGTFSNTSALKPVYIPSAGDIINGTVILSLEASATLACSKASDQMVLRFSPRPLVNAGRDVFACAGEMVVTSEAEIRNVVNIRWLSTGKGIITRGNTNRAIYTPSKDESGKIKLIILADGTGGCDKYQVSDTLVVDIQKPLAVNAGQDFEILKDDRAKLNVMAEGGSGNYSYKWIPATQVTNPSNKNTESVPLTDDQTFIVFTTDLITGCQGSDTVKVKVITTLDKLLKLPNAISPNGDGSNDGWWIDAIDLFPDNKVMIFNRWGDKVWEAEKYDNKNVIWNGLNKNDKPLPDGTYYYIIEIKFQTPLTGWVHLKKGSR